MEFLVVKAMSGYADVAAEIRAGFVRNEIAQSEALKTIEILPDSKWLSIFCPRSASEISNYVSLITEDASWAS